MKRGKQEMLTTTSLRRSWRTCVALGLAFAAVAAVAPRTEAATAFWYGVSGSNWSTATNWNSVSSGTGSYTPVNGDSLRWFQSSTNSRISNNDIVGLSVAGVSFQSTTGTYTLSGNKLTLTAGLGPVAASLVNINMPLELNASAVSFQGGADALKLNAVISETGGSRQLQVSTGTVTLGADNSFSNGIMVGINAVAAVRVGSIASIGVNQPLGSGTLVILGQSDGHGTLIYSGTGDVSTNKRLQVGRLDSGTGGTAIVRNDGSGVITWNGAQNAANLASNRTFILGGTNAGANTWAAAIVNNGSNGIVNFTKQDAGKWILSGSNSYKGLTTVSAGELLVNGNQSSAIGAVSVAAGAILGGTGTLGGISAAITGTVAPGLSGSLGTLTFAGSAMNFSTGGSLLAQLNSSPAVFTSDLLAISGAGSLTLGGSSILDLVGPTTFTTSGTYTLATFASGSSVNQFSTVRYNGQTFGSPTTTGGVNTNGTLVYNANSIQLVVVPEPGTLALAGLGIGLGGFAAWKRRRVRG